MNKNVLQIFKFLNILLAAFLFTSIFVNVVTSEVARVEAESIYQPFFEYTIISGSGTVIIDKNHEPVWSAPYPSYDKEVLPNGNLLLTVQEMGVSGIVEVDIASTTSVWYITQVDGMTLSFTHDTDWLGVDQFGQDIFLIADTYNNRVVEFFRNGTVIWSWYAADHYSYPKTSSQDWTHLNDVDRLPDGTTMISLKNFNIIAIVNTTATGEVLWEYGEYGNSTMVNGPHNPEYTPRGTLLIADSGNHRIIEVNMTTKEIIWEYAPTGDEYLGWPRDVDLLPNGNMLICDSQWMGSGRNTIWEINATTKEVVWYHDTGEMNYDAERLDTVLPTVDILNPKATSYNGTEGVPVSLSCDDPWYDEMVYRIYDETNEQWVTANNITYDGDTEVFLENQHRYTLHVWAKDLVMEGGAYPTSRATEQLGEASVQFITGVDETAPEVLDANVTADTEINFTTTVTDDLSGVKQVTLNYSYTTEYETGSGSVEMEHNGGDIWSVTIPVFQSNTILTYTITAEDNADNIATADEADFNYTIPELSLLGFLLIFTITSVGTIIYRRKKKHSRNLIAED